MSGRNVVVAKTNEVSTADLSAGVYVVQIKTTAGIITKKFAKKQRKYIYEMIRG